MDFRDGIAMIACEGPGVSLKRFDVYDNIGLPHDRKYFNSGVILMNLPVMREVMKTPDCVFSFIASHPHLEFHDQDILNGLFFNNVDYVDWHIYNQTIIHIKDKKEAKECLEKNAIIHYAGSDKPWKHDYKSWYFTLFWEYARRLANGNILYCEVLFKRIFWRITRKLSRWK